MRKYRTLAAVAVLTSVLAGTAAGQSFASNITGVVTDPNDAVVVGAEVSATSQNTGEVRRTRTNELGRYTFSQLLPAAYTIKVSIGGFRDYIRSGIDLGPGRTVEIDVRLELGQLAQAVEVTTAPPPIDTQTADQAASVDARILTEIPLTTRNPLDMVYTRAGVVLQADDSANSSFDQNHNRFSMNGGRETSAQIVIDGVPTVAGQWGGAMVSPGVESIQGMQIIANTYDAQYGKTSGGVIAMTTKGGTPRFHGRLFGSLQNDNLNANAFFSNLNGRPKLESKRNQFGATVSGPIWRKKKLYWQFGYDGLRERRPAAMFTGVPTAKQRGGDFSETLARTPDGFTLQPNFDPLTTRVNPDVAGRYIRDAFPGNLIPSSRLDRVGQNVMKLFPDPNQPGDEFTNTRNFYREISVPVNLNRYDFRVDWARSERHAMFARATVAPQEQKAPVFFGNGFDTSPDSRQERYHVSVVNNFILSPSLVVNVLAGGARWVEWQVSPGLGFDATTLGWSRQTSELFQVATPPIFATAGFPALGNSRYLRSANTIFDAQVNATKQLRAHSIKFGLAWDSSPLNQIDGNSPTFNFNNVATRGPDPDLASSIAGNAAASLLLGLGSGGSLPLNFFPAVNEVTWSWYVQDAWKVNRRLTFNYGLRFEIQRPRTERFNRLNYLDFNVENPVGQQLGRRDLYGGLVFLDANNRNAWDTPFKDFGPRASLAWKVSERLVLRAGYGIFFLRTSSSPARFSATGFTSVTPWLATLDQGRTFKDPLSNPFPDGTVAIPGAAAGLLTSVGSQAKAFSRRRPTAYMQRFSFDLQFQLTENSAFGTGYSGNAGRKLSWGKDYEFNSLPTEQRGPATRELVDNPYFGVITTPGVLSQRRIEQGRLLLPYPHFTSVSLPDQPGATSSYHAFTAHYLRRLAHGLMIDAEYRFSKSLDNASANVNWFNGDYSARDYYNMTLDRSVSSFDVPHAASLTFYFDLPIGKGRKFAADMHPILEGVLGGWSVSGAQKFQSGQPTLFTSPNNAYCYGCTQYPNVSDRSQLKVAGRTRELWFNTSLFSLPADFTIGNTPRYVTEVRSEHMNSLDLALSKGFRVQEQWNVQLRAEMLNTFNRTRFGRPNTAYNPGSVAFGQVFSAMNLPRIVQLTLRVNF